VVPLHPAVLLIEWLRSPPALPTGGDGGPPLKINRLRDKLFETGAVDLLVTAYRSVPELFLVLLHGRSTSDDRLSELIRRAGDEDLVRSVGHSMSFVNRPEELLTGREREVYDLLRQGLTNREIAQLLVISEGTAKLHVQHIFDKLGVRSRKAIAMQAVLERAVQATSAIDDTGVGTGS
jgi:DNA-binding CsgD family transcriptional regulator